MPSYGIIENADGVTDVVLAAMAGAPDPRLREVMAAFVRHLHAFAREVQVTQDEYDLAIDFLNRIGKATHDAHNEGILFADAVGFSTLVCLMNNGPAGSTETAAALARAVLARQFARRPPNGGSIVRSPTPGPALFVDCRITDADGRPIAGVEVDVWQASPVGLYENQDPDQADMNLRGRFLTARGRAVLVPLGQARRLSRADPRADRRSTARAARQPIARRICTCSATSPASRR